MMVKSKTTGKREWNRREKIPGARWDSSAMADVMSPKRYHNDLKQPSSAPHPSTSADVRTTQQRSYQSKVSTHHSLRSTITSPRKKCKKSGYNFSWRRERVYKKGINSQSRVRSKNMKQWTPSRYSTSSCESVQGTPVQFISGADIPSRQWVYYHSYIGNETRSIEFKKGGVYYLQRFLSKDICIYGCAFLNSGGGSLLVGVSDNGIVCGVHISHKNEDNTRLLVDRIVKRFKPPLLPYNYNLQFLPVVKPGEEGHHLKLLCLTFRAPPTCIEPTLFQIEGRVYMRLDGSVQGPLSISVSLEWYRQMWTAKMQQLEQSAHEAISEIFSLNRQVRWLIQFLTKQCESVASQQPQMNTARQSSSASGSLSRVETPDARPTHNTGVLDLAVESEHHQM
uniref:schlafen-like protein 1 n=1 Tax=Scatophagus argus TaxID=75038 RepID=UPI001ED8370A|nr:schlafen-like protein 1 [Scatophagus argus]